MSEHRCELFFRVEGHFDAPRPLVRLSVEDEVSAFRFTDLFGNTRAAVHVIAAAPCERPIHVCGLRLCLVLHRNFGQPPLDHIVQLLAGDSIEFCDAADQDVVFLKLVSLRMRVLPALAAVGLDS